MAVVDKWLEDGCPGIGDIEGHNWICVAKSDGIGCLDIDDPDWCKGHGMPALPTDVYTVKTPSGGLHIPFVQTDDTRALGNARVGEEVPAPTKENPGRKLFKPYFELKGNNSPWCAPHQMRSDGGKYEPICEAAAMVGIPTELIEWLKANTKVREQIATIAWEFHPDFDMEDFLEQHMCVGRTPYDKDSTTWVPVEECPLCGKEARPEKAVRQDLEALTKFLFSGRGYGFKCHYCGVSTREDFETKMSEKYPAWEPWSEPIYKEIELNCPAFKTQDADAITVTRGMIKVTAKMTADDVSVEARREKLQAEQEEVPAFVSQQRKLPIPDRPLLEQAAEIRESYNPKDGSASRFVPSFANLADVLSGEDHLFYVAALDSSGKTLCLQTLAADCASQGIGVTWFSGEHSAGQIKRRFYHLYAHHHRDRFDFELAPEHAYLKNTASKEDWGHLDIVRDDMLTLKYWPGPIDVRELAEFPGGINEVHDYVLHNAGQFKTGAVFIDPFDRLIECIPESKTKTKYDASTEILTKLLDWTKTFNGGQGLMLFLSCQLNRAFAPELSLIWKKSPEDLDAYEYALKNAKLHFFSNLKMRADVGIAIASTTHKDRKVVACHHARHSQMFGTFFAKIHGKSRERKARELAR